MTLQRRISNEEDLAKFQATETYKSITDFLEDLNKSCLDQKLGYKAPSTAVIHLQELLQKISQSIAKFPCAPSKSRFGKPEFRDFVEYLKTQFDEWLAPLSSNPEVAEYLANSLGSVIRIDYGSGHELNFLCFLLCLYKLEVVNAGDFQNLSLGVFYDYFQLMAQIQAQFWLEPAGSHGVWGLDDFHFIPFIFGSGQLLNDHEVRPLDIHDYDIVDMYKDTNYYFRQIAIIDKVKTASLRWHSPMLDDISGVKKWAKVNQGMLKMYKAEVLGKVPVIQHFLFGDILKPDPTMTEKIGETVHLQCWADCCGIRVPSAIAAKQARTNELQPKGHTLEKLDSIPVD